MEDNKSLTQEELNLYYYEKMIEKTYLFTQKCSYWTNFSYVPFIEDANIYANYDAEMFFDGFEVEDKQITLYFREDAVCLYLKDLLNLFTDPLDPTQEEFTLFNLEYGVDYIIKPNGEK